MDAAALRQRPNKAWPKVHLVYFILAAFDLLAVAGGLYLSHRFATIFEENVAVNAEWSRRFQDVWKLGDVVSRISEPGSHVFESQNPALERTQLNQAFGEFNATIAAVRREVMSNTAQSISSRPIGAMRSLTDIVVAMVEQSRKSIVLYEQGKFGEAGVAISELQRMHVVTRQKLDETVQLVRTLQEQFAQEHLDSVRRLKGFEYLIGIGIILMVCCVALYGHWIGRLMSSKYRELQATNEELEQSQAEAIGFAGELQKVNDEVSKLNRDLEENFRKLAEAQDEIVRKGRMAQLGLLTATVAHELRNPLGSVRTSAFLLQRKLGDGVQGAASLIDRINNGVVRCDNIITQLLDFSRSRSPQVQDTAVDEWLLKTAEEEAQKLPAAVEVECVLGLGDAEVPFDQSQMSRAIINLMSNASEAMVGKGDDPERFTTPSPKITIQSMQTLRGVEIPGSRQWAGHQP